MEDPARSLKSLKTGIPARKIKRFKTLSRKPILDAPDCLNLVRFFRLRPKIKMHTVCILGPFLFGFVMNTSNAKSTGATPFKWVLEDGECCETLAGQANPALDIDFKVSADSRSLDLKVDARHACDIYNLDIDLQIVTADAALWKLRASENGSFHWSFGPGQAHQLPDAIGVNASVTILATSESGTFTREARKAYLFQV